MNHQMLTLHHLAREARPTQQALRMIGARYKGVRFRLAEHRASLIVGLMTITQPVIEVLTELSGGYQWVAYQFLDPEDTP